MTGPEIHKIFIQVLENKIPRKTKLADFLVESLYIEKEAAYRRLRGDVQFSFHEVVRIAQKLHISIDEIILKTSPEIKKTITLQFPVYPDKNKQYLVEFEKAIEIIEKVVNEPYSEFGIALSALPSHIFYRYDNITKFHFLKYFHYSRESSGVISFNEIKESDERILSRKKYYSCFSLFSNTYYIWDRKIISTIVNDIKYFESIKLIQQEDIIELKDELYQLLYNLEALTSLGEYKDTGNKFELYISCVNIGMSYSYLYTERFNMMLLATLGFLASVSEEEFLFNRVKNWINSLKRCSVLISGIDDRERIAFFDQQREIVSTL